VSTTQVHDQSDVLRGRSCATPPGHERVTYRNFFRRRRVAILGVSGLRKIARGLNDFNDPDFNPCRTTQRQSAVGFSEDVLRGLSAPRKTLPSSTSTTPKARGCSRPFANCLNTMSPVPRRPFSPVSRQSLPAFVADGAALVEFGSGASAKTRLILDASPQIDLYVPNRYQRDGAFACRRDNQRRLSRLRVMPLVEDFTRAIRLPSAIRSRPDRRFFPGSTIGNFQPAEAERFLRRVRALFGGGALFIVGADLGQGARGALAGRTTTPME